MPPQFALLAERQQLQSENLTQFLLDAQNYGAAVYPLSSADQGAPARVHQEVLYRYENQDYQCLFSGNGVYHHRLPRGAADRSRRGPPSWPPGC